MNFNSLEFKLVFYNQLTSKIWNCNICWQHLTPSSHSHFCSLLCSVTWATACWWHCLLVGWYSMKSLYKPKRLIMRLVNLHYYPKWLYIQTVTFSLCFYYGLFCLLLNVYQTETELLHWSTVMVLLTNVMVYHDQLISLNPEKNIMEVIFRWMLYLIFFEQLYYYFKTPTSFF